MNVGMLWLDADQQRTLPEKVKRAADYYEHKYGKVPTLCLVNSQMLAEEMMVDSIKVQPAPNVLRHHFWVGVNG